MRTRRQWHPLLLAAAALVLAVGCVPALAVGHQSEALAYLNALGVTGQTLSEALNTFPDEIDAWLTEPSGIELDINVGDGSFRAFAGASDTLPFNQGTASVSTEAQAVARALQFLNTYGEALGSSLTGLTIQGTAEAGDDGWDVLLCHYEQGIRAEPTWFATVAPSGAVRLFVRYHAPSGPLPSPTPDITLEQAVAAACAESSLALTLVDWTLEITIEDDGQPHLVWAMELELPDYDGATTLMDIDAHSGELVGTGVVLGSDPPQWGILGPMLGPLVLKPLWALAARFLQH